MQNEELWQQLEKDNGVEKESTLREWVIGLIASGLYLLASGWLYFVTVMAR